MVQLTLGERIFVRWLIEQLEGVDKSGARMVLSLQKSFGTEDATQATKEEVDKVSEHNASLLEAQWVLDEIGKHFKNSKVPVMFVRQALELSEKLEKFKAEAEK